MDPVIEVEPVIDPSDTQVWVTQSDWIFTRGMDLLVSASCFNPDHSPFSLAGASLLWVAKSGGAILLQKSTTAGTITAVGSSGFQFEISLAESLLFPYGSIHAKVRHECKVKVATGEIYPVWRGYIRIQDTDIEAIP